VNAADWERYIESLVIKIAYIRGRLYRYKKDNQNCSVCYQLVVDVLNDIDFTFKSRASWNRSYLIPEEIFPYVYTKLTEIYRDFFPTKIQDLVHHIISRKDSQLSLYKEGYTNTLIDMFESLVGFHNLYDTANFLGDEAVKYVLNAVQNRSERCNFLLILCKLFAIIGDKDKSRVIYREILKSSMGPDWYKEAQLDLINGFGFFDIKLNNSQTAHFAAIFEEASGEMTFQRYVQQQKNQFVGTIAKVSSVRDAILYYKYETLPSSDVIISNAESWKVDMPTLGDGYDLGANHLIESSAICYLLLSCDAASPYIRYALNELFWENWDKIHNDQSYAKLHSKILMAMTEKDAINNILPRMAHYYVNEYNGTDRSNYLNYLEQADISESILCNFKLCLDNVGELWERCGKKEKENTDDKLRDRLNRYSSSKEVLTEMRQNIISPLGNYWSSLSDFFVPLVEKADFDSKNLFDVIVEHYNINVQPSTSQFKKFSWFQGAHDENDENNQLVRFLIWFLVHPENKISTRAHDALQWLFQFEEEEVLCSLTKEIMSPTDYGLDTKASEFLLDLTRLSPIAIRNFMNDEQFLKLSTISKFSISRNLYEIALIIFQTLRDESMLNIMKEIIPDELEDRGDVLIEEKDSLLIYHKIEGLNNLRLTGGKDFAIPYMAEWEKCFACGLVEKMIKSDRYIHRSFYLNYYTKQRYDRMMTNVLDLILYRKVDYKRAGKAYSAINN
ncbi:MAG: hypothetical protein ACRDDC_05610, partial [Tannerellaceae bacterium]